jgi:glutathione S-transferase
MPSFANSESAAAVPVPRPRLVIGSRRFSSWSMRPWLALKAAGIPFDEEVIELDRADTPARIRAFSPSGKVPCLVQGDIVIWESMAICEYIVENYAPQLWPADRRARATARAVAHEMHAGFAALRSTYPMDIVGELPSPTSIPPAAVADIERIRQLWCTCRKEFGESDRYGRPYLFGGWTIADCMFAPVVMRFIRYQIPAGLNGNDDVARIVQAYLSAVQVHPHVNAWCSAAHDEAP